MLTFLPTNLNDNARKGNIEDLMGPTKIDEKGGLGILKYESEFRRVE